MSKYFTHKFTLYKWKKTKRGQNSQVTKHSGVTRGHILIWQLYMLECLADYPFSVKIVLISGHSFSVYSF